MDAKTIERLDRRRYKVLLWKTINYGLIFPGLFSIAFVFDMSVFTYIWLAVMLLLMASQFAAYSQENKITKEISGNPKLDAALNNELIIHYKNLSYKWSFHIMLAAAVIVFLLSKKVDISPMLTCFIMLYTGVLSFNIFRLLLMRK